MAACFLVLTTDRMLTELISSAFAACRICRFEFSGNQSLDDYSAFDGVIVDERNGEFDFEEIMAPVIVLSE